ncbi:MAG: VOC family protein [Desulfarculaceae bacterium]|nr:VOC family protein [Desulfarculaceae bacterium]
MSAHIHHVSVFVEDMERALELFCGILGLEEIQRLDGVQGSRISALLGKDDFQANMVFLKHPKQKVCLELVRQTRPQAETPEPGAAGRFGISLTVADLDAAHAGLRRAGWAPLSEPLEMIDPSGRSIRLFCFLTEDGLMVELIQQIA